MWNVLLVVVDALRADRVGGDVAPTLTPEIDDLASSGERFTSCFACADKTSASMASIQTGLYPTRHGILHHGKNISEEELEHVSSSMSLQGALSETHETIMCGLGGSWLTRDFDHVYTGGTRVMRFGNRLLEPFPEFVHTLARVTHRFGTDLSDAVWSFLDGPEDDAIVRLGDTSPQARYARQLTDYMIAQIAAVDGPWFGYLRYVDTHMQYTAEEKHIEEVSDRTYEDGEMSIEELCEQSPELEADYRLGRFSDIETVGDLKRRYDAAVRCVDEHIGRLLDALEDRGELSDTIVIVTSDHGECLTENGVFFDHRELYDPTWHVPLVIKAPGFDGTEDRFCQHFDLVPTLLDLLDVGYEPAAFDGVSLVPDESGRRSLDRAAVFAEQTHNSRRQAVRTRRYKFIRKIGDRAGRPAEFDRPDRELFDLQSDPGETDNVAPKRPDICDELESDLDAWLDSLPKPRRGGAKLRRPDRDPELLEQLEHLGYRFD